MNYLTQTPLAVSDYFKEFAAERGLDTKLQIMIPGDSWSSETGFKIQEHDYFTNRDAHLDAYRERVQPTMEKQKKLEARVTVSLSAMQKFFARMSKDVPKLLQRPLRGKEVLIVSKSERETAGFAVDLYAGKVRPVEEREFERFDMRIEFPALILKQALSMNMFAHAGISKRVHFYAKQAEMGALTRFTMLCELVEAELFPLRGNFSARAVRALLPRWREGILYSQVLFDLARKSGNLVQLEEKYLENA
jgi:hypothetical protein